MLNQQLRVSRILGENELMPMPANGNNPLKQFQRKIEKKKDLKKLLKLTPKAVEAKKEEEPKVEAPKAEPKEEAPSRSSTKSRG